MIPIFIGSDPRQGDADRTLEYSIRKHSSEPVEFFYLRNDSNSLGDWGVTRPLDKWGTCFSVFRMVVPWLTAAPYAIYLDSDMLVLGDIAELFAHRRHGKAIVTSSKRSEVMVMDTMAVHAAIKEQLGVKTMADMRESKYKLVHYRRALAKAGVADYSLPAEWNHMDQLLPDTKLLHFTNMRTQPWKPWPEYLEYEEHRDPKAVELWKTYELESRQPSTSAGSSTPTART